MANITPKPIISLCFPTNVVRQFFEAGIEAVYRQEGVSMDEFEVIIADNGNDDTAEAFIKERFNYPNLYYYHTTAEGFTNQNECYKLAHGVYRKMINTRAILMPGVLRWMIDMVKKYQESKPILYFLPFPPPNPVKKTILDSNEFAYSLGIFISSSYPVGIWESDMEAMNNANIDFWFPHLALLFNLRPKEELKYIIFDKKWTVNQPDTGKGGYNSFFTFPIRFPELVNELLDKKLIDSEAYNAVIATLKGHLKHQYISEILTKTDHTFTFNNVHSNIAHYMGYKFLMELLIYSYRFTFRRKKNELYAKALNILNMSIQKVQSKNQCVVFCATVENEKKEMFKQHYLSIGFDDVIFFDGEPSDEVYQSFYNKNRNNYQWIAFFEIDEYLHIKKEINIKHFLNDKIFRNYQIININNGSFSKNHYICHIVRGGLKYIQFKDWLIDSKRHFYKSCNIKGEKCSFNAEYVYNFDNISISNRNTLQTTE